MSYEYLGLIRKINEAPTINLPLVGSPEGIPLTGVHRATGVKGSFQCMQGSVYGTFRGENGSNFTAASEELDFYA